MDACASGIGHPGHKDRVAGYVLSDFAKADQDWLDDVLRGIADGAPELAAGDSGRFLNAVSQRTAPARNAKPVPKKVKTPTTPHRRPDCAGDGRPHRAPKARGPLPVSETEARVRGAFRSQGQSCALLGSPFMGRLMPLIAERLTARTGVGARILGWGGDVGPAGQSVPLRTAGALHALVLDKADPALTAAYPPAQVDRTIRCGPP
jgi:hypothetical protein